MKIRHYIDGLMLCGVLLLATSNAFGIESGEEKSTNTLSTSDQYKLKIHGKKLDFKCSYPYSGSNSENYQGKSGVYMQGSILAPRVIRITHGESPVIIFQVGNDLIYYHNYFKIVLRN